jgi:hypothetical protein
MHSLFSVCWLMSSYAPYGFNGAASPYNNQSQLASGMMSPYDAYGNGAGIYSSGGQPYYTAFPTPPVGSMGGMGGGLRAGGPNGASLMSGHGRSRQPMGAMVAPDDGVRISITAVTMTRIFMFLCVKLHHPKTPHISL